MTTIHTVRDSSYDVASMNCETNSDQRIFIHKDVPITLIGPAADWFTLSRDDNTIVIQPIGPLPARCMIKLAAIFIQDRGFPEMNVVMGRILFSPGTTQPQRYQPFTRDDHRRFTEIVLVTEPSPDDALLGSSVRWTNNIKLVERLLNKADIDWPGLSQDVIQELVDEEPWLEPLEGCLLHALTSHSHKVGECVVEIGSLRGQSINMLARALEVVGSESKLISIDPHLDHPQHLDQVRLSLAKVGQDHRLIQYQCLSDAARKYLKPKSASLIFIDGDHTHDQVVADFQNYRDVLAPGGILVFHDYGYGSHNGREDVVPGVRPAIDEYVFPDDQFTPLLLGHTLIAFIKNKTQSL